MNNPTMKKTLPYILTPIVLIAAAFLAATIGVVNIPHEAIGAILKAKLTGGEVAENWQIYEMTLWNLRIPRILMSLLAGSALAICGAAFQSIFRNPICDPYILGISSGASLGAAIAIIVGWDTFVFGITLPALVTAILTLLLIMGIARLRGRHSTQTLLLTGIALNFFISAVITLLMVVNQQEMHKIFFWTMGSVATVSWRDIACLLPVMAVVIILLYRYAKELNILQLGTESAQSLGVDAQCTTYITLIASSVLIGVVVSFCGVIGFIGLIVPHIARLIFGSDNRHLFTYSLFFGALFLLVADTLARTLAAPAELPVGSITALAGAPYFIYLLLRKRQ